MTALLYIFLSAVQVLGAFYLSFSLFRFKLRSYLGETIFISAIIGGIIYFLRTYLKLGLITPTVVCFIMIMFMWLVIKIPAFYSTLMIGMGYLGIFIIESLLIYLGLNFKVTSLEKIQSPGSFDSYALILLTNTVLYLLGWWLYRKGFGFSFSFKPLKLKGETAGFLFAVFFTMILIVVVYYSVVHYQIAIILAVIMAIASLSTLIYLSIRKEYEEHD